MQSISLLFILLTCSAATIAAQITPPAPVGPTPSDNQLRWQEMEYYAFIHFSINTYTDMSWGYGNEDPALFNPTKLDARQWARVCKEAGMKGIILTAKHHSGFCLWPSEYTDYSVESAPWKDGKGDIVGDLAAACEEYGLKFGVYLSPWDRNHPDYGKPEYITYFRNQLRELLTNYGDIFEVWYDGANGGTGWYGGADTLRKIDRTTYYDWSNTYAMVRELQPDIVIWNDGGDRADLRWVGTESGYVGETNWSLLNSTGPVPEEELRHGVEAGDAWVPGEVNTSIRPEWFYHPRENTKVKTLPELMDIYYQSIGRNATLLLNFAIAPDGLIPETDAQRALDFAAAVNEAFADNLVERASATAEQVRGNDPKYGATQAIDGNDATYWTTDDGVTAASLTLDFGQPTRFNRFLVQEYIPLGQRVRRFTLEALVDGNWEEIADETTIGYKRILRFPTVEATRLRLNITDAKACPLISNIGVYRAPQILTPPTVLRKQSGEVVILPADPESELFYTLDGSEPTPDSPRYDGPIATDAGGIEVSAVAYSPISSELSPVTTERFGIARTDWRIVDIPDEQVANVIDGDPDTYWHQPAGNALPASLIIDLGKQERLSGFRYLPDQRLWSSGIITEYNFYVSSDGETWRLVSEGEFSNINNNPLWQDKTFDPVTARFVKLEALANTKEDNAAGYAELDVISESAMR
ncbi:alpha-L-fucosidase [Neolewinella xylanilytica]|uniref:alpha-L-fucosidase n=1 Tax=Neolewinella xylanilytica TaxID=1514080 RepID=A0A2S6I9L2_9BACT|nr:discoidin domain-containing protein [Neolewinella xylanilytica]PPK88178.1 alpha-L-fucosidase [Neolewinella xylanilytica]